MERKSSTETRAPRMMPENWATNLFAGIGARQVGRLEVYEQVSRGAGRSEVMLTGMRLATPVIQQAASARKKMMTTAMQFIQYSRKAVSAFPCLRRDFGLGLVCLWRA